MNKSILVSTLVCLLLALPASASLHSRLKAANDLLANGAAAEALEAYEALTTDYPDSPQVVFGRACAQYRLGVASMEGEKIEEARSHFADAQSKFESLTFEADPELARDAAYNRANCLLQNVGIMVASEAAKGEEIKAQYDQIFAAYSAVLEMDPTFEQARHNLNHARLMMKQKLRPAYMKLDFGTDIKNAYVVNDPDGVRLVQGDEP